MILCKLMSPGKTVAAGTLILVRAPLPRRMRPAKVHAQVCPLQLPEPGHFRVIIKGQRLQQSRWQLTQARQERLARGGILFSTLAGSGKLLLRSLQLSSAPLPWRHRPYPPPGPQSGFCRQQAVAAGLYRYAGETGACPGCTCLAACGVCGRGANGDSWYYQAVRQQRKSSGRCSPTDAHTCTCWIVRPQTARNPFGQADRSGSCSGSGAASSVFFGPGSQQSGYEAGFGAALALLAGNDAVAAGQGIRQCPGNSSQGYKYSGADAFCQGKMDAGHGRLLLAAWYLTLPTRPESRPAL